MVKLHLNTQKFHLSDVVESDPFNKMRQMKVEPQPIQHMGFPPWVQVHYPQVLVPFLTLAITGIGKLT